MRFLTIALVLGLVLSLSVAAMAKDAYTCPMHPEYTSERPGDCPVCGMRLVPKKQGEPGGKKIKFYRNPMNPDITSPVPRKDEMGMEYIPVYEGDEQRGVYVSPQSQRMIGVAVEKAGRRDLKSVISAAGRVAYDPGLFVAQEEYLQAVKTRDTLGANALPVVREQASSLAEAAKRKLLLLGMNEQGIDALTKQGAPQESLYLPGSGDTSWVYISVYEYEIGMVSDSQEVEVTANAYPGQVFKGKVSSLAPVLNSQTRTMQVRAVVEDPGHKLKPEMFVNASITRDLGQMLVVPESAVLDTGVRKIVYVKKDDDTFEQRQIKTGVQTNGYYQVLEGVSEGEQVVTNGNFLIDSESRMKAS